MANVQVGYGHGDVVGVPFDYYTTRNGGTLATGQTLTLATPLLVLDLTTTLAALTVNLPLNPPDGAVAEISATASGVITTLTVAANTGDSLNAAFAATLTGPATLRWRYSLNGDITRGANARTWVRCQ